MATELFSFKILIHGYSLDPTFYSNIGGHISLPGFAVQLFDFPTFVIYSQEKLHHEQVGHNQWIRFGNGKNSAFEMTTSQINKLMSERHLFVNFIDAENKQVRVFSKVIVTLQTFKNDITQYSEKNQDNWKRKVFLMFDEMKNQVGQLDLSISLIRTRKDTFNNTNINSNTQSPLYYQQPKTLSAQNFPVYPNPVNKNSIQVNNPSFQERPKTSGIENNIQTQSYRPTETVDVRNSTEYNNKATIKNTYVKDDSNAIVGNISSLKTITEGFYCPPMMVFQKKKKTVKFAGNPETQDNFEGGAVSTSFGPQSTKFRASSATSRTYNRGNESQKYTSSTGFDRTNQYADTQQANRPVVVLSNKESEKLVDLFKLKDSKDEGFGLVDALIRELVTLRTSGSQQQPLDNTVKAESLKVGALRTKESSTYKDPKSSPGALLRRSSFGKEAMKENSDANTPNHVPSPKRNRLDSFKGLKKGMGIANEIIKETYEEANAPETDYSQDFESISASQSLPQPFGTAQVSRRKDSFAKNKNTTMISDRIESIEESYADDFDQLSAASASHNMSAKYPSKYHVKVGVKEINESKDISEDLESGSRAFSSSQIYGRNARRESKIAPESGFRDSRIMSEYSEDFEEISDQDY